MATSVSGDQEYLHKRVLEETRAALRSPDPKAAARHVELATRYLTQMHKQ